MAGQVIDDAVLRASADDLYEQAPCGYLYTTPDGLIVKTNRTLLDWLGYERDEVVGRKYFADLLRVGGKLFHETHFAPLLQMHGLANEIAFDLVGRDGRIVPTLVSAIQKRDPSGQPLFHQITVFNASERRRYEQELLIAKQRAEWAATEAARLNAELVRNNAALQEHEDLLARTNLALQRSEAALAADRDRLRQILDALPVAVLIAHADGQFALANAAAQRLIRPDTADQPLPRTGHEALEQLGLCRPDGTPYPPQDLPLQRSLRHGAVVEGAEALIRPAGGGRDVHVLINSAPLCAADGAIAGAVAVLQDVTPLKDMERAREEFLGAAAHDLKTPLTSMRGLAQLARRRLTRLGLPEVQPIMAHLEGIETGAGQMATLINQLVDITRLQMGALLELHRRPVDLVALTRAAAAQQQDSKCLQLVVEADQPELVAAVDAERIERVLSNLIGNAVKYSPDGGQITVRVAREDGADTSWAVLVVRDSGLGIPASDLPRIFDRYYRASNVPEHIQGTGIGLASVRQIVERHGGAVTVASQEGAGTTVTVRLPLQEAIVA
jgi:two-component system, OmpR family, phosphate regulon sensor histidine kinase PhoR